MTGAIRDASPFFRREFAAPALVGLVCFAVSFTWSELTGAVETVGEAPISSLEFVGFLLLVTVITPVVESIVFAAFLFFVRYRSAAVLTIYAAAMGAFGWWAHGSDWGSVGKGAAFAILAVHIYRVAEVRGLRAGTMSNIAAHGFWNMLAIMAAAIATGLAA